jgi:hypothetical protein
LSLDEALIGQLEIPYFHPLLTAKASVPKLVNRVFNHGAYEPSQRNTYYNNDVPSENFVGVKEAFNK